jgi:hypothetical protein
MTKKEREHLQIKWKEANQAARQSWAVYKSKPSKVNKKIAFAAYDRVNRLIEQRVGEKI